MKKQELTVLIPLGILLGAAMSFSMAVLRKVDIISILSTFFDFLVTSIAGFLIAYLLLKYYKNK